MAASSRTTDPSSPTAPVTEPLVVELDRSTQPEEVFRSLACDPHVVFFDSAMRHQQRGRYSYVAADPYDWYTIPADGTPALEPWIARVNAWVTQRVPGLPPWQGGAAGVIGYEIGHSLERLPRPRWDEFGQPALAMGLYDTVVAFDHEQDRVWALSHGFPATGDQRRARAEKRMEWLLRRLAKGADNSAGNCPEAKIARDSLAPSFPTPYGSDVTSDFAREDYLRAVERVIAHLRAGEAFQVNLSQRLLAAAPDDPVSMYLRLRSRNPAPFGGYLDGGNWRIASASPERFLRVEQGLVETRPIKGTRPLGAAAAAELLNSEKDRAENVMIVDLLRNDLSRVCEDASIDVPTLFALEPYAHVQHLVSIVEGKLRSECGLAELLAATLPAGSITGAPKIRAQQIIASLEPTARGAYCGALAWVGFPEANGQQAMDSSVLIRTLTHAGGWVQAPVGGGVVVRSDPATEYEETWHKAAGLIDAVVP